MEIPCEYKTSVSFRNMRSMNKSVYLPRVSQITDYSIQSVNQRSLND